jgi:hypothetical protein
LRTSTSKYRSLEEEKTFSAVVGDYFREIGPWTKQEKETFEAGLEQVGKDFKRMAPLIPTRSIVQIRRYCRASVSADN